MKSTHVLLTDHDLAVFERLVGAAHPICKRIRDAIVELDDPILAKYRVAAAASAREGCLEIDHAAVVSKGDDDGAYVMAWLWVSDEDADVDDAALQ